MPITLAALVLAGCGGKDDSGGSKSASSAKSGGSCDVKVGDDTKKKPTVTVPKDCDPPGSLVSKDIVGGTGEPLKAGQTAVVHYDLYTWSNQSEVEASWDSGQPFPVQNVGQAAVIDGWNEGLPGMKQGGRRLLIIPPDKGYGAQGSGSIKANETLVFVVDVVQISG